MKDILNYLFEHKTLSRSQAKEILINIGSGKYNDCEIASFLSVYIMRSITVDEFIGFRDALLELCIRVDLSDFNAIDLCGTGGDGKNTFNISTLASFVTAGAGIPVAKHGNSSVSSACGSSNVMEYFGYKFTNDQAELRRQIETTGLCFLHAPLFHPAMKNVAPVRRSLRVKTFFNMLGPIVNPSFPKKQMVGVFSLEVARLYQYLHQQTDKQFIIIHSLDGYDEISLTSDFKFVSNEKEQILSPVHLGLHANLPQDLFGGNSVEEAARIFKNVLTGEGTPAQNNAVIANAAMAIQCAKPDLSLFDCVGLATDSLHSNRALDVFHKLVK